MRELDVKSIALFFYFTVLDEKKAVLYSSEAVNFARSKKRENPQIDPAELLVLATSTIWNKYRSKIQRGRPNVQSSMDWKLESGVNLTAWKEFQKQAKENEVLAIVWLHILKIDAAVIGKALNLPIGTFRFRANRGLESMRGQSPRSKIGLVHEL